MSNLHHISIEAMREQYGGLVSLGLSDGTLELNTVVGAVKYTVDIHQSFVAIHKYRNGKHISVTMAYRD